ncbi:MAG: WGR domain-containing protein [Thiohalocapsa sp.]
MPILQIMTPSATQHSWINPEKARYYQVFLDQDLFGDWTLIKVWGGIGSNRGRMHSTGVTSYEAGIELVDEIARRRSQRGYTCAPPTGRS